MDNTFQLYLRQYSSFSLFGKCGKFVISIILILSILFSLSIFTYAADDGTINTIDLDYKVFVDNLPESDGSSSYDVTYNTEVSLVSSGRWKGFIKYILPLSTNYDTDRILAYMILDDNFDVNTGHEYNINFDYGVNIALPYNLVIRLVYYDVSGSIIKEQYIAQVDHEKNTAETIQSINVDFLPDTENITGGFKCQLEIGMVQTGFNHSSINQIFYFSSNINLSDKDDNSGWFQKIIAKINDVWESIKSLPDKIGAYIQQIATDITDGLKSLFVPEDGFFDTKKQEMEIFLEEHFGVIFTAPNILITIIEKLLTVEVSEPIISFPKIQFDLLGTEYSLIDKEIHLNLSDFVAYGSPYHILYKFYRAFATGFLIVAFANYCKNKYDYLFGKDGEAV